MRVFEEIKEKRYLYTIYFTIIMGFIAHGFMIMNKITNHDDVDGLKESWNTFELGRWGQSLLNKIARVFYGSSVSVPWLIGIVSIIMITASAIVFIKHFEISNMYLCLAVGGILITFPSMTSTFTYVYIVAPFCMAIFMAFLGSVIVINHPNWKGAIIGIALMIASLSMYQTYIGIAAAVLVLQMIRDVIEAEEIELKDFFIKGFFYVITLLAALIGYVLITKGIILLTGWELKDYQNLRSMGVLDIMGTIKGVAKVYLSVPLMITTNLYGMTSTLISKVMTAVVFVLNLLFIGGYIKKCVKSGDWLRAICIAFLALVYPLAYNMVYLMGAGALHTVMVYPTVMLFLQCIFFSNTLLKGKDLRRIVLLFAIAQLLLSYVHTANVTYLKMDLVQKQSISYMTTVITQIRELDEYSADKKISFIVKATDPTLTNLDAEPQFGYLEITGTNNARGLATMRRYDLFLKYYCGFNQECINIKDTGIDQAIIAQMPIYPEKGSIQIIDDIIVVKFDEMD